MPVTKSLIAAEIKKLIGIASLIAENTYHYVKAETKLAIKLI